MKNVVEYARSSSPSLYPTVQGSSIEEVKNAIKSLRNNKAPRIGSITGKIIKYVSINNIWVLENMHDDRSIALFAQFIKKSDKTECKNYRGISPYKIPAKILVFILTNTIGDYQSGFRKEMSTTDQIFNLGTILEKFYKYNLDLPILFIDCTTGL